MKEITFNNLPEAIELLGERLGNIERLLQQSSNHGAPKLDESLLTVQEAAEFLKLTVPTIYSKVSRGELPVMKRSKRLYFSQQELMRYIKDGRKEPVSEIMANAANYLTKNRRNER